MYNEYAHSDKFLYQLWFEYDDLYQIEVFWYHHIFSNKDSHQKLTFSYPVSVLAPDDNPANVLFSADVELCISNTFVLVLSYMLNIDSLGVISFTDKNIVASKSVSGVIIKSLLSTAVNIVE